MIAARISSFCSLLALLPSLASAQLPRVTYTADTNVGCFAKIPTRTQLVTFAKGRSLPIGIGAIIMFDSTTSRLSLTQRSLYGVEASLYWYGRAYNTRGGSSTSAGTTQSTDYRNVVQGPHSIMVGFVGNATGTMTIYYGGSILGVGGKASVAVDMDANGRTDYRWSLPTSSKKITFPYSINGTRRIRVTGDCLAFTTATGPSGYTYSSSLRFVFEPFTGGLTSYGTGCGPVLTGTIRRSGLTHSLSLTCRNAYPNKPVMFSIGAAPINVNFPGTNCPLLTAPLVIGPTTANSIGYAYLAAKSTGFYTGSIYFQAIPWDLSSNKIATSNGLRLTFK